MKEIFSTNNDISEKREMFTAEKGDGEKDFGFQTNIEIFESKTFLRLRGEKNPKSAI